MKRMLLLLAILLIAGAGSLLAQSRTVTGRVLDETGVGIPGAAVGIKGTAQGTVTDLDGNFTLEVPDEFNTLTVQSIGYTTQDVQITGQALTIRMAVAARELQGAVVTALAIRREKREIGYAATTLDDEDLNRGNNVSALSAIQGKTAGVNITSSTGGPGGSSRVVIRGEKSLQGNNNALLVVDGIIINNNSRLAGANSLEQIDFGNRGNDINPEDIESITVLKGPAAAALYGAQGAAGAIMITTKSGRSRRPGTGKTEITYQTNYTLQNVLRLPEFQNTYGQGNVNDVVDDRRENFSWGIPFNGETRPWGQVINGQQKVKPYEAQPDNVKRFFRTGTTWENSLGIGNSSENSSFYLSLNTLNNKGVIPNNFYDKYSVRFNGTTALSNKFYASININYVNIHSRVEMQGQGNGAVYDNVLQTPRDIPLWELKDYENDVFNSMQYTDETGVQRYGYYGAYTLNPYWVADKFDNRNKTDRALGALVIGFRPNEHWDIFNRFGGDVVSDRVSAKQPKFFSEPFDPFYTGLPHGLNGGYFESVTNNVNYYDDLIARYTRDITDKFGLSVMAGGNVQQQTSHLLSSEINPESNGLVVPDFYNFGNATGPVVSVNTLQQIRSVGIYGNINLSYDNMLFLELTGRNDWSSTLAPGNWSFFYPSANLSYVFTESFNPDGGVRKILNYGKIFASAAAVGLPATQAYLTSNTGYISTVSETNFGAVRFPFNSVPGYTYRNVIPNPELRNERTNNYEVGVNLGFLKERIVLNAGYYYSKTIDGIVPLSTPASTGFTTKFVNVGEVSNKGIELELRAVPIRMSNGLRWEVFGTYTKNTSEVLKLEGGSTQLVVGGFSGLSITATVGQPYGAFYATDLLTNDAGQVVVDSATGMPQLTPNPVYKGSYQPRFIASWGTSLSFKNFNLNVLFNTKQGGVFFSRTKDILDFVGTAKETENRESYVFPNSVYLSGDGSYVQNNTPFEPYNYYTAVIPSGQHVIDASYVKLQEASLTYTIPSDLLKRLPIGHLSVGIFGNNLFIWTAKENMYVDPEVNSGGATNEQGFDFTARPSLRNYGMMLRVSF